MRNFIKQTLLIFIIFFCFNFNAYANVPHFLDFKYILNQSDAGKKAQSFLKNKLEKGIKNQIHI